MRIRARLSVLAIAVIALVAGCSSAPSSPNTVDGARIATQAPLLAGATPTGSLSPTPSRSATPSPASAASPTHGCSILPADNVWRADVSHLPVLAKSATYVASIGAAASVHADFGSGLYQGAPIGIPITTVSASQAKVKIIFRYASESDLGPYPIPKSPAIEGGASSSGDRHVILYDPMHCMDYELFAAYPKSSGGRPAPARSSTSRATSSGRPAGPRPTRPGCPSSRAS